MASQEFIVTSKMTTFIHVDEAGNDIVFITACGNHYAEYCTFNAN